MEKQKTYVFRNSLGWREEGLVPDQWHTLLEYTVFHIKKKNGKLRRITAPNKELLKHQRAAKCRIEHFFNQYKAKLGVGNNIFGFTKGTSVVDCARRHVGYKTTLMFDIVEFFDNTTKDKLFSIREFSEFPELQNDELYTHDGSCGQGFASSPIIANLIGANIIYAINLRLKDENFGSVATIYADDIQVSIDSEEEKDILKVKSIVKDVVEVNDYEVNPSKTRVRYAKYGYRRILGVNVGDTGVRAPRKIMRKIRAAEHQGAYRSLGGLRNWVCQITK